MFTLLSQKFLLHLHKYVKSSNVYCLYTIAALCTIYYNTFTFTEKINKLF